MDDPHRRTPGPEELPVVLAGTHEEGPADESHSGHTTAPMRLAPLLPRRQSPWLLVEVDGSPAAHGALVWALREAARREATVVAVCVPEDVGPDAPGGLPGLGRRGHTTALARLEAQVLRAMAETGITDRIHAAVLERPVLEALTSATRGADLVVVGPRGKTLLRPAIPRQPTRRLARGA